MDSEVVFYYSSLRTGGTLEPADVAKTNIGELEAFAAIMAKTLQLALHRQLSGAGDRHRSSASACPKESGYAHLHTTHYIERSNTNSCKC